MSTRQWCKFGSYNDTRCCVAVFCIGCTVFSEVVYVWQLKFAKFAPHPVHWRTHDTPPDVLVGWEWDPRHSLLRPCQRCLILSPLQHPAILATVCTEPFVTEPFLYSTVIEELSSLTTMSLSLPLRSAQRLQRVTYVAFACYDTATLFLQQLFWLPLCRLERWRKRIARHQLGAHYAKSCRGNNDKRRMQLVWPLWAKQGATHLNLCGRTSTRRWNRKSRRQLSLA